MAAMSSVSRSLHDLIVGSTLRERFAAGELVTAGWLQSGEWKTARALAAHHEVVVIDAEHGAIDLDDVALCVEVMAGNGCLSIVRVPLDDDGRKAYARRCLDAGAIGILFPNVRSREQAEAHIRNCYYPEEGSDVDGTRGFGYGGCNKDGHAFAEYAKVANSKVLIGCQLEHKDAFKPAELEAILKTPGLRFTQDGPYDHSGSYFVPGETSDSRVLEDLTRYREACKRHGVPSGKHVVVPTDENIAQAVGDNYAFIALGTDLLHVMQGASSALDVVKRVQAGKAGSGGGEEGTRE